MRKIRTVNINSRYRFELWCGTKGEFHFILFLEPGSNHYFLPAQVHNGCQVKPSHLCLANEFHHGVCNGGEDDVGGGKEGDSGGGNAGEEGEAEDEADRAAHNDTGADADDHENLV